MKPFRLMALLVVVCAMAAQSGAQTALGRTVLPISHPNCPHRIELDARKATPPPRFEVKSPEGAPNVLIVLIDDMGFGMPRFPAEFQVRDVASKI